MSRVVEALLWLRDTVLRLFPHPVRPGLRPIGNPGPDAPLLLTGNFALTVRRLERALAGRDAWLLVADSDGINVWCAAGGGHLTHHDVIAVVRSSGVLDRIAHRRLILPQLAATGVERRLVQQRLGLEVRWGPARLEDLPAYLDRGGHGKRSWRVVRFPLWERMEMALMWAAPMTLFAAAVLWPLTRGALAASTATALALTVFAIFAALPWLPVTGHRRWLTYGGAALFATGLGWLLLAVCGAARPSDLRAIALAQIAAMGLLSIDLAGTTPCYPSTINMARNHFSVALDRERCTGAAECVQVCPRDVLHMDGRARKVTIARPEACIRCGACVVQCPEDALYFRFDDGRIVAPAQVRRTRLNLLGRRTIAVPDR